MWVSDPVSQNWAETCGSSPRRVLLPGEAKWRGQKPLCGAWLSPPRRRPCPRRHCCPGPLGPLRLRVGRVPATGNDVAGAGASVRAAGARAASDTGAGARARGPRRERRRVEAAEGGPVAAQRSASAGPHALAGRNPPCGGLREAGPGRGRRRAGPAHSPPQSLVNSWLWLHA